MPDEEKKFGVWILWGVMVWVIVMVLGNALRLEAQELPARPQGDLVEHEGRKLLCYNEDNARLIARWVVDVGPMLYERNKLLEELVANHTDALRTNEQLTYQLELELEVRSGQIESLEDKIDNFNFVLSMEVQDRKRSDRLHWLGHIVSIGAVTGLTLWGATR